MFPITAAVNPTDKIVSMSEMPVGGYRLVSFLSCASVPAPPSVIEIFRKGSRSSAGRNRTAH